jgi:hypothetical protein
MKGAADTIDLHTKFLQIENISSTGDADRRLENSRFLRSTPPDFLSSSVVVASRARHEFGCTPVGVFDFVGVVPFAPNLSFLFSMSVCL